MKKEKKDKLHCIQEITIVKNPLCAQYLAKDRVVMSNTKGCFIVDLKTKEAKKINKGFGKPNIMVCSIRKNEKKIVSSWGGSVRIYNAETGALEWNKKVEEDIQVLGCCRDNIYLLHRYENEITKHNYLTNSYNEIPTVNIKSLSQIRKHPQQEIICVSDYSGKFSLYRLDGFINIPFKKITLPSGIMLCQFSSYKYVVAGDHRQLFIIDTEKDSAYFREPEHDDQKPWLWSKRPHLEAESKEVFEMIAFNPRGSVLATVSHRETGTWRGYVEEKKIVRYWDCKTCELIDAPLELDISYDTSRDSYDLSFSNDGLELMIVFNGKCIRTIVPFAVKEKCAYVWWVLQQLKEKESVPQDVINYCGTILLETFKF